MPEESFHFLGQRLWGHRKHHLVCDKSPQSPALKGIVTHEPLPRRRKILTTYLNKMKWQKKGKQKLHMARGALGDEMEAGPRDTGDFTVCPSFSSTANCSPHRTWSRARAWRAISSVPLFHSSSSVPIFFFSPKKPNFIPLSRLSKEFDAILVFWILTYLWGLNKSLWRQVLLAEHTLVISRQGLSSASAVSSCPSRLDASSWKLPLPRVWTHPARLLGKEGWLGLDHSSLERKSCLQNVRTGLTQTRLSS